jgi:hypothetical protein
MRDPGPRTRTWCSSGGPPSGWSAWPSTSWPAPRASRSGARAWPGSRSTIPAGRIVLDLKDVTLVDRAAVQFLARVEMAGTELVNCPEYVRSWIAAESESR